MTAVKAHACGIALAVTVLAPRGVAQCLMARVLGSDQEAVAIFGEQVAVAADPRAELLVGASGHSHSRPISGAVYVFGRGGTDWQEADELFLGPTDAIGLGAALAVAGGRAVVGAIAGWPRIFEHSSGRWIAVAQLRAERPGGRDRYGHTVALDGNTALVGAYDDSQAGPRSGAVYIFERDPNGAWVHTAKLMPPDAPPHALMGWSLAIDGDVVVAGAPADEPYDLWSGSAYVFERDRDGRWSFTQKLVAPDGHSLAIFGGAVAVAGDILMVGAEGQRTEIDRTGAVYVYRRESGGQWTLIQKFWPPTGQRGDAFGSAIAIDGDLAVIGARFSHILGAGGAAYVYQPQPDGTWSYVATLLPPPFENQTSAQVEFGKSVAIRGRLAVVGAPFEDLTLDDGTVLVDAGAAYVFAVSPDDDGDGIMDACQCPGDVDHDFAVTIADLQTLLAHFGTTDLPDDPTCEFWPTRCAGDLDADRDVDLTDLSILLEHWGELCP